MRQKALKAASLLRRTGLLAALGLAAAVTVADIRRVASPIVVNSAADFPDASPYDGKCETAPGNGVCTLRAAIEQAEALPGAEITFEPEPSKPDDVSPERGSPDHPWRHDDYRKRRGQYHHRRGRSCHA